MLDHYCRQAHRGLCVDAQTTINFECRLELSRTRCPPHTGATWPFVVDGQNSLEMFMV